MTARETPALEGRVAFYCVVNSRHFLGVVALINSLRLLGHDEPVLVGDAGLEAEQCALLAPHAMVVTAGEAPDPRLLKWAVPLRHPAETMILVDADVVLTRSLTPILLQATDRIAAFVDRVSQRFHPEWGALLGLGQARLQPYVNSGLVVLPRMLAARLLPLIKAGQSRVDVERSVLRGGHPSYPFYYPDQDVWNAVLASAVEPDELLMLDHRLAPHPPFPGVRLVDEARLRCCCAADAVEPYALHHAGPQKPWLASTRTNVYSRVLTRLLLAPDLPLRLEPEQVPLRLRTGALARADRKRATLVALARAQRGRLGAHRLLADRRVQAAARRGSSGRPSSSSDTTPSS